MKFHYQIFVLNFLLLCIAFQIGFGQISTISGVDISPAALDSFLNAKMEALNIPGLSIAVINDKKIVYHRALGVTNAATKIPVDQNTIFEAASLTKPLFAYFVFKMMEKELIDLDTPLYKYLPNPDLDYDERYKLITARNILSHTSGLPNWRYMTNKMMYLELLFKPGDQFSYSGEGYEYLANTITHRCSGTLDDLEEMIQQEVLRPLDMSQSGLVWNENMDQHKAHGHSMPNLPNNRFQPLLARASGGLHSNAQDYASFLIALMNAQGLSRASFNEMLQPAITLAEENDIRKAYGIEQWTLGFARQETLYGAKYSHGGNNGDFQSYFEFYKAKGVGYVYMTNSNLGDELNLDLNEFLTNGKVSGVKEKYEIINRKIFSISEAGDEGVSLNAGGGAGIAWLKDRSFQEGVIEFDVRGDDLREKSFVGLAFHGQDAQTYDCIYFRPYLFQTENETERDYMVQYIAMPQYDWFNLRSEQPGAFEGQIIKAPDANSWFHVKIEIAGNTVKVFVDNKPQPSLEIEKLNHHKNGKIGFWVGNLSKGDFANLKIRNR